MRFLVTGGTGYVGGVLCDELLERGHQVRVLTSRIRPPSQHGNLKYIVAQISDISNMDLEIDDVDSVIYLAGVSSPQALKEPVEMFTVNTNAAQALYARMLSTRDRAFVYASTQHVETLMQNSIEGELKDNALRLYATSKLAAEILLRQLQPDNSKYVTSVRISNCFGAPNLDYGTDTRGALNDFCLQGVSTGVIRLRSSGHTTRRFVSVRACASLLVATAESPSDSSVIDDSDCDPVSLSLEGAAVIASHVIRGVTGKAPAIEIQGKVLESVHHEAPELFLSLPSVFRKEVEELVHFYVGRHG